jgi:hypothetical protein
MTKILEQAIAKARELTDEDQDALGAVLLSLADELPSRMDDLDEDTRGNTRRHRAGAARRVRA